MKERSKGKNWFNFFMLSYMVQFIFKIYFKFDWELTGFFLNFRLKTKKNRENLEEFLLSCDRVTSLTKYYKCEEMFNNLEVRSMFFNYYSHNYYSYESNIKTTKNTTKQCQCDAHNNFNSHKILLKMVQL